uniref:Uncharacterized protein n=1 Tax=Anguilla anguilla TaxID=7936 RepID=A0A0E9U143_ANGAN
MPSSWYTLSGTRYSWKK